MKLKEKIKEGLKLGFKWGTPWVLVVLVLYLLVGPVFEAFAFSIGLELLSLVLGVFTQVFLIE